MYFHSHATFAGNGVPLTVQLANPSLYTETYGLDGEGRLSTLMSGSIPIVSGTTYNPASQPTYIDLGTGTDQSDYLYDPNTDRMTNWTFQVGSTESETGVLTWNPNWTLKSLVITDGFNAGGSQTCDYNSTLAAGTGYDDLGRLVGVSCGSVWAQTFSYDEYNNITKSGSVSWNPGYNASNNQYDPPATYDTSGNLTYDTIHTYTWDPFNKLSSIDSSACSTGGECITYDGLGRMVESSYKGTYTEIWYTQLGKTAYMLNGDSIYYAYWPTPGGATVEVNGNNVTAYYMHKDWLGSSRISSVIVNPAVVSDQAYAPYSEVYDKQSTGAAQPGQMFTGETQDVIGGIFDTPNRELNSSQGRWLSPDPVRAGWNQYAYVADIPLNHIDPSGLFCQPGSCGDDDDDDDGPGDPCPAKICDPGPPPGGPPGVGPGGSGGGGGGGNGGPGRDKNTCAGPNPPVPCRNAGNNQNSICSSANGNTIPVNTPFGQMNFQFSNQGNLIGLGLQLTGANAFQAPGVTIPPNTFVGVSQLSPGTVQFGFSSPVQFGSGFSQGYFQTATYSGGTFTSVQGAWAPMGIPFGSSSGNSSLLQWAFNGQLPFTSSISSLVNLSSTAQNVGDTLTSLASLVSSNVSCQDVFGGG
jgi:RHS repeat-associated protein